MPSSVSSGDTSSVGDGFGDGEGVGVDGGRVVVLERVTVIKNVDVELIVSFTHGEGEASDRLIRSTFSWASRAFTEDKVNAATKAEIKFIL